MSPRPCPFSRVGAKLGIVHRRPFFGLKPTAEFARSLRDPLPPYYRSSCVKLVCAAILFSMALSLPGMQAAAQVAPQKDDTLPVKPPPVPTGVIPLPQGSPPTGQQAPVPAPARPLPKADRPLTTSPALESVNGYIAGRAITLQDTIAIALYTNRDFASAAAALQQAQGRRGQARALLNPTAGVNGQITEFDAPTTADLSALSGGQAGSGAAASPPFLIVPQFNPVFTASFSLPLDIAGTLRSAVSQAQFQEVAARIDVNRVRNDVVVNVKVAFYNVLRAQEQIVVATDTLNNALGRLNDANKNYAAGTAPRFDVISAQRDVADAQQGLINARAQLSANMAALKSTMGIEIRTHLRITNAKAVDYPPGVEPPTVPPMSLAPNPVLPVPGTPIETPAPVPVPNSAGGAAPGTTELPPSDEAEDNFEFGPEYDGLVRDALKTRPEILEGDAQIAAAQRGVQYARRTSLPSFSVGLSDTYTPNAAGFTRRNEAAVTLGVEVPIFDGGLARERVREARGVVASAEINRRRSVDQVQVDVQQAYISLVQARNRVAVANVGLAQAREAFRLARVRYNAGVSQLPGVSPQLELSNAQTTLAQAQSNQVNALYDYNSARAQLDHAVGRYSFTGIEPGYSAPPSPAVRGIAK
jgi:outer membrane protein